MNCQKREKPSLFQVDIDLFYQVWKSYRHQRDASAGLPP